MRSARNRSLKNTFSLLLQHSKSQYYLMIIFRGNIEKERQDIKINPKNKKITADFEMKVKITSK